MDLEFIKSITASAVIPAIISLVIAIGASIRRSKLKYITGERQKWRENMRNIVPRILSTNRSEKRKFLLEQLRLGLNPEDNEDQKITRIIDESLKNYPYAIPKEKNVEFRNLVQNLLKYEWEKAKYEAGLSFSFYEFLFSVTLLLLIYNLFNIESWVPLNFKAVYVFLIAFVILVEERIRKFYKNKDNDIIELLYFIFKKPFRVKLKKKE